MQDGVCLGDVLRQSFDKGWVTVLCHPLRQPLNEDRQGGCEAVSLRADGAGTLHAVEGGGVLGDAGHACGVNVVGDEEEVFGVVDGCEAQVVLADNIGAEEQPSEQVHVVEVEQPGVVVSLVRWQEDGAVGYLLLLRHRYRLREVPDGAQGVLQHGRTDTVVGVYEIGEGSLDGIQCGVACAACRARLRLDDGVGEGDEVRELGQHLLERAGAVVVNEHDMEGLYRLGTKVRDDAADEVIRVAAGDDNGDLRFHTMRFFRG